jgi:hypothetical protein
MNMTEQAPYHNREEWRPQAESYQMVAMLTSDVVIEQRQHELHERQQASGFAEYNELYNRELTATKQMYAEGRAGRHEASKALLEEAEQLRAVRRELPAEMRAEYERMRAESEDLARGQHTVGPHDVEAQAVQRILAEAPRVHPMSEARPPLADYGQNDSESWRYAPEEDIKNYLLQRRFIDTDRVRPFVERNSLCIKKGPGDEPLEVPLDLIVYVEGFDSWLGRGKEGRSGKRIEEGPYSGLYDRSPASLNTIKHYASLPTEIPPIDDVRLFIQPDGTIIGDNFQGDSHRVAAAALRGDTTIKTDAISIYCLSENVIEPDNEEFEAAA